ncbi:MAG: hypothetical protein PHW91_06575 [Bacteroidales bacterium]|jgi:hypothetical protein|nr:hypothetical protein [Bacteroidales bacterium]
MKKIPLFICIVILVISCNDKTASNLEIMKKEFETQLKDKAFANNVEIEIFKLDAISYDTISENFIDTLKLYSINSKIDHFQKLAISSLELAKLKRQQLRLYASLGDKTLTDISREDLQKYIDKFTEYEDSIQFYAKSDSLIREKIKKRVEPKDFFQTKFFIKATSKEKDKRDNILDTINIYFNDQLKIIDLNK